jgi:hypothetical protein
MTLSDNLTSVDEIEKTTDRVPAMTELVNSNDETTRSDNVDEERSRVMITLISNDDRAFQVPLEATKLSGFIVDTLGLDDDDAENDDGDNSINDDTTTNYTPRRRFGKQYEPIVIPRVNGEILQMIIDFLMHYKYVNPMPKIQQPIVGDSFHDVMTDVWYQQYITQKYSDHDDINKDGHKNIVFQILEAANFMEISPIIDLTCLWCTFQISGKSTEEVGHR